MTTEIPTLTKRKLQAQVIGPIFEEMVAQIGDCLLYTSDAADE